jgi:hypothetical protein
MCRYALAPKMAKVLPPRAMIVATQPLTISLIRIQKIAGQQQLRLALRTAFVQQ